MTAIRGAIFALYFYGTYIAQHKNRLKIHITTIGSL